MKRHRPYKGDYEKEYPSVRGVSQPQNDFKQDETSCDLPGFYYDKEKRRYFRIVPGQNNNNPITNTSIKRKEAAEAGIQLSETSRKRSFSAIPKSLASLQLGSLQNVGFTSNLRSLKMASLTLSAETDFTTVSRDVVASLGSSDGIEESTYLVGYPRKSIAVGSWATRAQRGQRGCMIRAVSVGEDCIEPEAVVNVHPKHRVVDLCITEEDNQVLVTYVCVNTGDFTGTPYTIVSTSALAPHPHQELNARETRELDLDAAWCCARDFYNHRTAVGLERKIEVFQKESSQSTVLQTGKENPFSLRFNEAGNLLYGGSNKGSLFCFDLRGPPSSNRVTSLHMGRGISYLSLLRSEEAVLGSGYDGKLFMVDLKQRSMLHQYEGHSNDGMKIPLSFDTVNDMLCSTGQDRVTRFWQLNVGEGSHNPIAAVLAPEQGQQPWSWYSSSWSRTLGRSALCLTSGIKGYMYV
ncbi:DDB1- and CUL4-associated factor 4-like [Ornithodoros turicata]|uniref:DDB1- and CUL4-associated factor 4-like n=1 Tax=Ornithodoros turicata TaxID=34597 RepID=UPI00313983EC